jgi:hypothetical protein
MDAMEFFDIDGDGKPELIAGQSDVGAPAYSAQTGRRTYGGRGGPGHAVLEEPLCPCSIANHTNYRGHSCA